VDLKRIVVIHFTLIFKCILGINTLDAHLYFL
jgi:hypothetical protein